MPEPELLPDQTDADAVVANDDNGRIAAGQAFAAQRACGEPGHGDAVISQPRDSAFA